jgi:hypothetical protein
VYNEKREASKTHQILKFARYEKDLMSRIKRNENSRNINAPKRFRNQLTAVVSTIPRIAGLTRQIGSLA